MRLRLTAVLLASLLPLPLRAALPPGETVLRSIGVIEERLDGDDDDPAPHIVEATKCVIVLPRVIKGAFIVGGRRGHGTMLCRQDEGWSLPVFVKISGGSVGLQVGGESTSLVLLIVDDRSVRSLLKSKFTLGVDVSVSAGPQSKDVRAETDGRLDAEIYSYASSRGLFAGASVDGAKLTLNRKPISNYYGAYVRPEDILFDSPEGITPPPEAVRLQKILEGR